MTSTDIQRTPYFCIKLKTGETLLSEVTKIDGVDIHLKNPFIIEEEKTGRNNEGIMMMALPWIPFCNNESVKLLVNHVYYFDYLNEKYKKFYGTVLLQHKIADIKSQVEEDMEGTYDYSKMRIGVDKIKETAAEICAKFGIEDTIDTSAFDKKLDEFKNKMH